MLQRCLRYIRNFFGFTRGEARGFSVLALLLVLVYTGWFVYRMLPQQPYNPVPDQQQLDSLISLLEAGDTVRIIAGDKYAEDSAPRPQELFYFNPNTVTEDSLLSLGFPPYLAQRLLKYRSKGGRFRKKEDLLKMYGMQESLYNQIAPWVILPNEQPYQYKKNKQQGQQAPVYAKKENQYKQQPPKKFDLNRADSLQLLAVRGIGPVLSGRILKFREALGGFVQAEQVREVWGLSPEVADLLLERAYVGADVPLRTLPVNTAEVAVLSRHPYISRKQAELIVAYRSQHGSFQKPEDLLQVHTIDEKFIHNIRPYLQF